MNTATHQGQAKVIATPNTLQMFIYEGVLWNIIIYQLRYEVVKNKKFYLKVSHNKQLSRLHHLIIVQEKFIFNLTKTI